MGQTLEIEVKYWGYVKLSDATGLYVSWCPLLDIKSQGTTQEQARAALDDSVKLFVMHCFRRGILEQVLKSRGLEPQEIADAESSDDGECVSVRPLPAASELLDAWEGTVPLFMVASNQMQHPSA
jgi:hypothetical protein